MIHLDTSFLIRALVAGSAEDRRLSGWIATGEGIGMSAVAWAEFLCGPLSASRLRVADSVVGPRVDFTGEDAVLAARLFNECGRRRGSLPDCMIAAVALGAGARLATADEADFHRFEAFGVKLA
ncbi:type II toxin-antitoxin system VapC family toxin [Candidatus Palauibacter sp.]|uniref:type II toxin-antitoxin system VapC family toxin n=1 Tax=Candidatus Palauibacter sp. TaxID=3101350 RepID=UPI003B0241E2